MRIVGLRVVYIGMFGAMLLVEPWQCVNEVNR